MSKLVKDLIAKDLRRRYGDVDSALWVELVGADGVTTNELRHDLHTKDIRLQIVKTALLRRAVDDRPLGALARKLSGPAALVTGGESVVDAAKALGRWLVKLKGLKIRGALLEGELLDEQAAAGLATMPSRRELQARLAGVVRSPGSNLASAVLSGGSNIAGCLKSLIEKLEKGESTAEAA